MALFDGSRKAARRGARQDRKEARLQAREARIATRQAGRTSRQEERSNTRAAAYAAGIDPNAFIGDAVKSVANVAGAFANPAGAVGLQSGGSGRITPTEETGMSGMDMKKITPLLIGAAVLFFFLKKKK